MTSRRMLAGIALGILLLTFNASTAFVRMRELDQNSRRVAHTHRVLAKLQETHSLLQAGETGKHRFLLGDDPHHLGPVLIAIESFGGRLSELRKMTQGNPRHQVRLDRLEELADHTLREFRATVESRELDLDEIRGHLQ